MSSSGLLPPADFDFLCVDAFLQNMAAAQALKSALSLGLIEQLQEADFRSFSPIQQHWQGDDRGLRLLLDLLAENNVIELRGGEVRLTSQFKSALRFRDLLEARLDFADFVAPDVIQLFPWLLVDPGQFMRRARIFDLFSYQRCFEASPENYAATRRWMRFTTCMTRYEARACLRFYDFGRHASMLDIGGNSGEFVLQVCRKHPRLCGTILDLPLVCDIGREHILQEPEASRITFIPGNALVDALPSGFDLIAFKSMLHDWPDEQATHLLAKASRALAPGGALMIFERAPIEAGRAWLPYFMIPMLLFFRSFRYPGFYQTQLERLGFVEIDIETICLEMPFFLVTARRGG